VTSLVDLLSRLLEGAFAWLPRPQVVPEYAALVRWTLDRPPVLKSGLVWIVPLLHTFERADLRAVPAEFEPKILWTKDGREAAIGMAVVWRVSDPLVYCKAIAYGVSELVSRVGESVLPELVGRFDLDDLKRKAAGGEGREWRFDAHLQTALGKVFEPYGISIDLARINFTSDRVRTLKLIGGDGAGRTA
jgi:regulator of protease activity HflC (stomatin/prohibitin superfamily)